MHKKIFQSSCLTSFLVLVTTIALIMGALFHFFEEQIQKELENEAGYLSQAVEKTGIHFFDGFEKQANRVTLVDADGNVLFDSDAEVEKLDNHADREEINAAMKNGTGKSIRYSQTLMEKTVNYAVRLLCSFQSPKTLGRNGSKEKSVSDTASIYVRLMTDIPIKE